MSARRFACVAALVAVPAVARADALSAIPMPAQEHVEVATRIAGSQLQRIRRSIAVGPVVGGALVNASDTFGTAAAVSVGVALYRFDIPSVLEIQEILKTEIKRRLAERIAAGQGIDEQLVHDVAENVKRELLGELTQRTLERPSFGVAVEAIRIGANEPVWGARLTVSKGVSVLSVGIGAGYLRDRGTNVLALGPELSIRLTPTGLARTPVLELFGRAEYQLADGEGWMIGIGGRLLIDVL